MRKLVSIFACVAVAVSGCATVETSYRPVVDLKGVDPAKYEADLGECRQYAVGVMNSEQGAAAGAVAGALLGVAIGAILGVSGRDLARVAGSSAVVGGASGASSQHRSQTDIVKSCLAQRGYRVLGG
jgi:outer membrane lipoprotein SlyB